MSIEPERFAISAENTRGRLAQGAGSGELIDGHAAFKPRIDANERLGPKSIAGVDFFDLNTDVRRPNLCERAGKPLVIPQESFIEFKDIHNKRAPTQFGCLVAFLVEARRTVRSPLQRARRLTATGLVPLQPKFALFGPRDVRLI